MLWFLFWCTNLFNVIFWSLSALALVASCRSSRTRSLINFQHSRTSIARTSSNRWIIGPSSIRISSKRSNRSSNICKKLSRWLKTTNLASWGLKTSWSAAIAKHHHIITVLVNSFNTISPNLTLIRLYEIFQLTWATRIFLRWPSSIVTNCHTYGWSSRMKKQRG